MCFRTFLLKIYAVVVVSLLRLSYFIKSSLDVFRTYIGGFSVFTVVSLVDFMQLLLLRESQVRTSIPYH